MCKFHNNSTSAENYQISCVILRLGIFGYIVIDVSKIVFCPPLRYKNVSTEAWPDFSDQIKETSSLYIITQRRSVTEQKTDPGMQGFCQ